MSNLRSLVLRLAGRGHPTLPAVRSFVRVLNKPCEITDRYWHAFSRREIFSDEVYRLVARRPKPFIIDCGANVGMSVVHFKNLYPDCTVVAFEPDPTQFQVLQRNVASYGLSGVTLYRNAVWNANAALCFQPNGGVGGGLWTGPLSAMRSRWRRFASGISQRATLICSRSTSKVQNVSFWRIVRTGCPWWTTYS